MMSADSLSLYAPVLCKRNWTPNLALERMHRNTVFEPLPLSSLQENAKAGARAEERHALRWAPPCSEKGSCVEEHHPLYQAPPCWLRSFTDAALVYR
jgi:hypothetical protein